MSSYVIRVSPERRAKEDRLVLLRLHRAPATFAQLRDDLGARLNNRIDMVVTRLMKQTRGRPVYITTEGRPAMYSLTDEGKAFAAQLAGQSVA